MRGGSRRSRTRQLGLTLVEMLVSVAISLTVLGGVVQVLLVSKSNFISERELATLQENARYALKFLGDEIRMAGYTGCASEPLFYANSVRNSSTTWYTSNTGLEGFEYEAGINSFPAEFRGDVLADTDAVIVRRGETTGLALSGTHSHMSAQIPVNRSHAYQPGQIMLIASPNCQQIGIFQLSGPTNNSNNATLMVHNQGNANPSPGNCTKILIGDFDCTDTSGAVTNAGYPQGARLMALHSAAYYIGSSGTDSTVPALYRERLVQTGSTIGTRAEELAQGIENMQLLYGLDNSLDDGVADIYVKASSAVMDWSNVVTVRLTLRMRSVYPVYNQAQSYPEFEGISGTGGSDRFLRQTVSTTIQIRNS